MTAVETTTSIEEMRRLVAQGKITLPELLDAFAKEKAKNQGHAPGEEAPKPKAVVLSDDERKALRTLPVQLADLELPGVTTALSLEQKELFVPLFDRVKIAKGAIAKAESALQEAMHGDIDAHAPADAPIDKNGHRLTPGEVVAPSYPKKVVRGMRGGKSIELTDDDLQKMEADGVITHAEYLKVTKSVPQPRVPVPDAVMGLLRTRPELVAEFAARTRASDLSTAITMSKNDGR